MELRQSLPVARKGKLMGRIPSHSARIHKNEAHIAGPLSKDDPEFRNTQSPSTLSSKNQPNITASLAGSNSREKCVVKLSDFQGGVIWRLFFQ